MPPVIRLESQHALPFPREEVWPIVSNTDWLNRSLGLPSVDYTMRPLPEGGSAITARAKVLGMTLEWEEFPFEWLEPEFYEVHRVFRTGPFVEARMGVSLRKGPDGGTRVTGYSNLTPRGLAGKWLARYLLGPKAKSDMQRVVGHLYEFLRGLQTAPLPKLPVHHADESALRAGLDRLGPAGLPADLVHRLAELLRDSPDVELSHIRPLAVARKWRRDSWEVLRLFLHATRHGLLDLSWEVLCPNCRSSRQPRVSSLVELPRESHCEVCQIKFDAEFDKSVELKFAVNPAIRPREDRTFCLAGPGGRLHVLSQAYLEAGQRKAWRLPELTRPLRLRSPQVKEPVTLRPDDAPTPVLQSVILCQAERFLVRQEYGRVEDYAVQVLNPNPFPVLLVLEQPEWHEDILTAARVTNWQEFRDLFSGEVISPHEQITVGSQVVLFTDLRGSTAMYHGLGDAPAYALVRNHFLVLTEAVRAHHGTVVKTIGDAVMAVFSRVGEALAAVRQMHEKLPAANPNPSLAARLQLKSSLHVGPCLAVNANERLDFFGTTINLAARMVDCCQGGDLTVSDELFGRPEMQGLLKTLPKPAELAEVRFRGFEAPHKVWRIPMSE